MKNSHNDIQVVLFHIYRSVARPFWVVYVWSHVHSGEGVYLEGISPGGDI